MAAPESRSRFRRSRSWMIPTGSRPLLGSSSSSSCGSFSRRNRQGQTLFHALGEVGGGPVDEFLHLQLID